MSRVRHDGSMTPLVVLSSFTNCALYALSLFCLLLYTESPCGARENNLEVHEWWQPGTSPPTGAPPPIGSGGNAPKLIGGDTEGSEKPPPSGIAQTPPVLGTNFPHEPEKVKTVLNLVMNIPPSKNTLGAQRNQPGGQHIVLTLNRSNLSAKQNRAIQQILGPKFDPNASLQNVDVTEAELIQIQQQLYPYPEVSGNDAQGRQIVDIDARPANGYPKQTGLWPYLYKNDGKQTPLIPGQLSYRSTLTTIRPFCKYLVLIGVWMATIFMILAAYSVICGHRDGGARVVASAAGLILLLMAFSIWKVVVYNTRFFVPDAFQITGTYPKEQIIYRSEAPKANLQPNDTPRPPASVPTVRRSNMPIQPLGASVNR